MVGLLCAFLANGLGLTVFGVQGQPVRCPQPSLHSTPARSPHASHPVRCQALLYLVPLTLGPLVVRAWARGELGDMMRGPACFADPHAGEGGEGDDGVSGDASASVARRDAERSGGDGANVDAHRGVATAAARGAVSGRATRSPEQPGASAATVPRDVELGRVRTVRRLSSEGAVRGERRESPIQQVLSSAVRAMREASEGSGEQQQQRRNSEEEAQLLDRADARGEEKRE